MQLSNSPQKVIIPDEIKEKWQGIINITADLIHVPAALIMKIIEPDITVFLASFSNDNPYTPGEKEHLLGSGLYCETVIKKDKKLIVPNALKDKKWKNNPDVKLNMIAYMGYPIKFPDGRLFGTICVLDNRENKYSQIYEALISNFRDIIEKDIELLWMNKVLGEKNREMIDYVLEIKTLRGIIPICSICKNIRDDDGYWQKVEDYMSSHAGVRFSHGICDSCAKKYYGETE